MSCPGSRASLRPADSEAGAPNTTSWGPRSSCDLWPTGTSRPAGSLQVLRRSMGRSEGRHPVRYSLDTWGSTAAWTRGGGVRSSLDTRGVHSSLDTWGAQDSCSRLALARFESLGKSVPLPQLRPRPPTRLIHTPHVAHVASGTGVVLRATELFSEVRRPSVQSGFTGPEPSSLRPHPHQASGGSSSCLFPSGGCWGALAWGHILSPCSHGRVALASVSQASFCFPHRDAGGCL